MFEINANVGDLKRVFGIIRCSSEDANVFLSNGVLCVESQLPVVSFSRACIRSCGGIVGVDGSSKFVVNTGHILGVLSTGRNHEIANILYDGENNLRIRICNVAHDVVVDTEKDIEVSCALDNCSFVCMQSITGKDFIAIAKSAHDSSAEDISVSTIKSVFMFGSNGGKYASYVEGHSDTLLDYYSKFNPNYLYSVSNFVRSGNEMYIMFSGDSPVNIRFDINGWKVEYLLAPTIDR